MSNDWLTVEQAAAYIGKSLSTVRRIIPAAPAGAVRRQGGKVFFKRDYLEQRYNVTGRNETAQDERTDVRQYIASLEADNAAKTQIIAQLTESNAQLSRVNAALLLARNPQPDPQPAPDVRPAPDWYLLLTIIVAAIGIAVVVWLVAG